MSISSLALQALALIDLPPRRRTRV
jgi:hypothetical protein